MKTLRHFFTVVVLLCATVASSQSFEVDGINYNVTSSTDKTVEVSGGSNVLIPESVTYNGVTYSVTSIGGWVFNGRNDLTGELVIPNSVTSIGDLAFYNCSGLTSVVIGNSVTSIGEWAFEGCSSLTGELVIPNSVTSIGIRAFCGCSGLTSVVIPNSVTSIGESAFWGCSSLTSVEIPNSVTSIGNDAFGGCSGLKEVHINDLSAWCNISFGGYVANPLCNGAKLYLNGELVTELVIPEGITEIKNCAFRGCSGLISVVIPNSVTCIGGYAFDACSSLTSVVIPNSVTSIGDVAFWGCSGLTSVEIPNSVTSIGYEAFRNCSGLTSVVIPNSVTSIGESAFWGCSSLTSVVIGNSVTSIRESAFGDCSGLNIVDIKASTPPSLGTSWNSYVAIVVPEASIDVYKNEWATNATQITSSERGNRSVEVAASGTGSALRAAIGDELTTYVYDLKVKGSINSYDVIVLRTKMPLLRNLDLSEATVMASDMPFYNGNCTKDNDLGGYAFYGLSKLNCVKLPKDLVAIGDYMFDGCSSLRELEIPKTVSYIGNLAFYGCNLLTRVEMPDALQKIGVGAFSNCSSLKSIVIPKGVKSLPGIWINQYGSESWALFNNCKALESVTLPDGLEYIGERAFCNCSKLKDIKLPPTVKTIDVNAFIGCSALEEIRIPSSVTYIGGGAFNGCDNLKKVYTYTVEPLAMPDGLFPSAPTATLCAPSQSRENYYFAAGWNSFLKFEFFDEPYEYFYVNNDYVLNDDTGYIEGTEGNAPDADINAGGGFIVEGEQGDEETPNQNLGDVNVGSNGEGTCGSIIGDNNLHIDDLHIKITVSGGRWYFFAFPFDIKFKDITMQNGSDYVFRYYDGEERAKKGNGGWKDVNEDHLKAARGYIFQCSANDVLILSIKDVKFKKEDKFNELVAHVSENLKDASWNFTGNPYLSYYDLADMDYTAPVTVWDGEKYVAIRPGDDDYHFAPYEAFFVQKPDNQESIGFDGEEQMTQNQSENKKSNQAAARRTRGINPERQLINLVLSNGISDDRTRIVFNDRQSLAYETACDATKFETSGVVQFYTIDSDKVHYAINERPADNGRVLLGYTAPTAGFYTIEAQRMDTEVLVKDLETGTLYNLKEGAYGFSTDAGTFNERFEILLGGTAPGTTGIDEVEDENGNAECEIYDLLGRKMKDAGKGIYIINGEKVMK